MFRVITGRAGTGKSTTLLSEAVKAVKDSKNVIILVPDQVSFSTERSALSALYGDGSANLAVLSFSRLCENIFRALGGIAGTRLTDTTKLIAMRLAINEIGDTLSVYQKQCNRSDFMLSMIATIDELKNCGTYPDDLKVVLSQLPTSPLRDKLTDIASVYRVYQGIIERNFSDPQDDIHHAIKRVVGTDYFADTHIFIDGFHNVTAQQRSMIEIMLEQAQSTTIAICCDEIPTAQPDIFAEQRKLVKQLQQHAMSMGVKCSKTTLLDTPHRYINKGIMAIESYLSGEKNSIDSGNALRLLKADDKYDEMRFVCAEITRLVREESYRYRDIAIIVRSLADYESTAETLARQYDVPLFYDKRRSARTHPLPALLLCVLDCVKQNFATETVLSLCKNPCLGIASEDSANLENYAYLWSLRSADWQTSFAKPSDGLVSTVNPDDEQLLSLEHTREQIIAPLQVLKKNLQNCTGVKFAQSIYQYMQDSNTLYNLQEFCAGDIDSLGTADNLYNSIVSILEEIARIANDTTLASHGFSDLFATAVETLQIGEIPNTNDQTVIGSADRIRLDNPRIVFVVGANEGVFPASFSPQGVFSKKERETLASGGVELSQTPLQRAIQERFFVYTALSSPRELLYVTHFSATLDGQKAEPSFVVEGLSNYFGVEITPTSSYDRANLVVDIFTAREQFSCIMGEGKDTATHAQLLQELGDTAFIELMEEISQEHPASNINFATADRILGDNIRLSPTAIEQFYRCPYSYFCERMLDLKKRKKIEYTGLESGTAIHYVLEHMILKHSGKGISTLTDFDIKTEVTTLLQQHLTELIGDVSLLEKRFIYQMERLVSVLLIVVRHMGNELAQSDFSPIATEATVGYNGDIRPPEYSLSNNSKLSIIGKVDRVDTYSMDSANYVRIIDYKSGTKSFSVEEVFHGLNMQMLIYLNAICEGVFRQSGKVEPAGILYMPSSVSTVETTETPSADELQSMLQKELRMSGLLVEDIDILRAMERELEGKYIPARTKKNGEFYSDSNVKSRNEFNQLRKLVEQKILDMGNDIVSGNIAPSPVYTKNYLACSYCNYSVICKNDPTANNRDITKTAKES